MVKRAWRGVKRRVYLGARNSKEFILDDDVHARGTAKHCMMCTREEQQSTVAFLHDAAPRPRFPSVQSTS